MLNFCVALRHPPPVCPYKGSVMESCDISFDYHKILPDCPVNWDVQTPMRHNCNIEQLQTPAPSFTREGGICCLVSEKPDLVLELWCYMARNTLSYWNISMQIYGINRHHTITNAYCHHNNASNAWWLLVAFGWRLRLPTIYDEIGAAVRNIHCYTAIGFW